MNNIDASNIISLPLAFVRSGVIGLNDGKVYGVSHVLYGWSRAATSASVAYNLGVSPTEVSPSNYVNRWTGFPLRCFCMLKGIWKYRIFNV